MKQIFLLSFFIIVGISSGFSQINNVPKITEVPSLVTVNKEQSNNYPANFKFVNGNLEITEVVKVEGLSSKDLFKNAVLWVNNTFNNPKTVIQTKDNELGLITLKTIVPISNDYYGNLSQWFDIKMTIQVKDGRYKYDITDIIYNFDLSDIGEFIKEQIGTNTKKLVAKGAIEGASKEFAPLIRSLKTQMSKQEEDW